MSYQDKLSQYTAEGLISNNMAHIIQNFNGSYIAAIQSKGDSLKEAENILEEFIDLVAIQLREPHTFEPFHQGVRKPIDYYAFGLNMFRPLVDFQRSKTLRLNMIEKMKTQLSLGHNVILLANHQTEPDPQAISLLLEKTHSEFAENIIFVAGNRVIEDPLAVPFSMGRNLLCIYSKKYIDHHPELKSKKLLHNQRTMKRMSELLAEGGHCIYVAPSGGRDRPNEQGCVEVAPFDPQSIEMFWLMAQQAKTPTHFYPLTLATFDLFPPPNSVLKELGEVRQARCSPIHIAFNEEISMDNFPGSEHADKKQRRQMRADYIWDIVKRDYEALRTC